MINHEDWYYDQNLVILIGGHKHMDIKNNINIYLFLTD